MVPELAACWLFIDTWYCRKRYQAMDRIVGDARIVAKNVGKFLAFLAPEIPE